MTAEERGDQLEARVEELETRVSQIEDTLKGKTSGNPSVKKRSIQEVMKEKNPSTDTDRTLVIGHYLEHIEGKNEFTSADVKSGFKRAKEPVPSNVSECIRKNIKKGYIMETGETEEGLKGYQLTNSGEEAHDTELGD